MPQQAQRHPRPAQLPVHPRRSTRARPLSAAAFTPKTRASSTSSVASSSGIGQPTPVARASPRHSDTDPVPAFTARATACCGRPHPRLSLRISLSCLIVSVR